MHINLEKKLDKPYNYSCYNIDIYHNDTSNESDQSFSQNNPH